MRITEKDPILSCISPNSLFSRAYSTIAGFVVEIVYKIV